VEIFALPAILDEGVDWIGEWRGISGEWRVGNLWAFGFFEGPEIGFAFELFVLEVRSSRAGQQ
jgi:hypothetical protein